jgi:beta-lysine 5,6-aminomutase beta subunit
MEIRKMMIKPYGDTLNDGKVQVSFTLPVDASTKATEAASIYMKKLGFESCEISHTQELSKGYTFFVAYGTSSISIDYDKVVVEEVEKGMDYYEVNNYIEENIKRKLVIVGACTGTDAHTVGIDAIMNMKGYDHHYGLERYPMIEAYNLGAQIENEEFIQYAKKVNADAILISQIVTQKEVHIHNLTNLIELLEAEGLRDKMVVIIGGPRVSNRLALELGYDAGFGRGTYPDDVASYVAKKLVDK